MTCAPGHPDLDRTDPTVIAEKTRHVGTQHDRDGIPEYHLRNCLACGSTLAIPLEVDTSPKGC